MSRNPGLCAIGVLAALCACSGDDAGPPGGSSGFGGSGGDAGSAGAGSGGTGGTSGSGGSGGTGGTGGSATVCTPSAYQRPVDVLFVVDNSGSMREEQAALREQFPRMIESLTSGQGSTENFIPVFDLHLGVVSTDMGLPDVPNRGTLGCREESARFGDDGVLRILPNPGGAPELTCATSAYPSFLNYTRSNDAATDQAAAVQLANDFACVASLGTTGCGFEMQLESALRALWPSDNVLINGAMPTAFADTRPFYDTTMFGKAGPTGLNTGFLRNDPELPSLLAIVVVTDEEDCSSHSTHHFVPPTALPADDPLLTVAMNLRCYNEAARSGAFPAGDIARDVGQANLYGTHRYAQGFKALRPDNPGLLVFAAVAGVPTDLTTSETLEQVDFGDAAARNAYYDGVLNDPRMIEQPDPSTLTSNPNLVPSCSRMIEGSDVPQRAYPPRRLVKVAKEIGENALLQSICQDDFTPVIDAVLERITSVIRRECPTGG